MASLVEYVRNTIDPKAYYSEEFKGVHWPTSTSEGRVDCCFHEDKNTPSLSLNPENGKWYCHACGAGGKSIVSFHAKRYEVSQGDAARYLFKRYVHPIIPDKQVRRWKRRLNSTPSVMKYLVKERKLKKWVLEKYDLGWDGARIVIPIRNEFGLCVNAKLFDPLVSKKVRRGKYAIKMLNYQSEGEPRSYGSPPMLYPIDQVMEAREDEWIAGDEGELDALLHIGLGLRAVTSTAGCKSWPSQYNSFFSGKKVATFYDNNNDKPYERTVVLPNLIKYVTRFKAVDIPTVIGKDVTDWYIHDDKMWELDSWLRVIKKSKTLIDNPKDTVLSNEPTAVPLDLASQARWFNQRIQVDALVTGKENAPYILPRKFRVSCNKQCDTCPLAEVKEGYKEVSIEPTDPKVLRMVDKPSGVVQKMMMSTAGMAEAEPTCNAHVDILESFNLERLLLIPTLDSKSSQYVMRGAYHVGHGLHGNRSYRFEGVTTVDPDTQQCTHLFDKAKPVQDEIETFELKSEMRDELRKFRPGNLTPLAKLMSIAEWQSRHITKIKERPDLHIAADLVFHSVRGFQFNGEEVRRGMLDVLIIGDTRCGKGYVAEGISRYIGLGEVASADNCSFAGLVGGVDSVGRRYMIKWGLIPLNNDRAVVIDEASSLSYEDIGKMTRIRSEGVAEISKIVRESTKANCRLLWLSNTRDGQPIMEQGTGVKAIKNLMGANEDVSRFDFAMTVATNEVSSEVINDEGAADTEDHARYSRDAFRWLVLWAWSRRSDQIVFTEEATHRIIQQAIKFGREFSPKIPLVQAENIRIKLAKISAAVAARVFSTDKEALRLIVDREHVDCACEFLRMIYCKPSMAYDVYSKTALASSSIGETPVSEIFRNLGRDRFHVMSGLLDLHKITSDNLADYYGDPSATKLFIGDLVKERCLTRIEGSNWYLKNPAFTAWLRAHRKDRKHASNGQANHH